MNHCFADTDRPPLTELLTALDVGEYVHVDTLPGHCVAKAYQRLYDAVKRIHRPYHYQITANRQHGGVTCERTS